MYNPTTVLEFRKKRFRQRLILVIGFFWFLFSLTLVQYIGPKVPEHEASGWRLVPMIMLLVGLNLPTWLFLKINARCPSCGCGLDIGMHQTICKCCGARLEIPSQHPIRRRRGRY